MAIVVLFSRGDILSIPIILMLPVEWLIANVVFIGQQAINFFLRLLQYNFVTNTLSLEHNKAFLHGFFSSEKMVNFYKA